MSVLSTTKTSKRLTRLARRLLGPSYFVLTASSDAKGKYLLFSAGSFVSGLGWTREQAEETIRQSSDEYNATDIGLVIPEKGKA